MTGTINRKGRFRHPAPVTSAFQKISGMSYEYNADVGLSYASPVRGVWNIVHIGTLVPGGHQIYVCPTSCLRGVVLTTAEMGRMDKLSTITVGEDNILEGNMEEMLLHGTERIISELPQRPRMMMIFTSCIHHFMAVNYRRVYKLLRKEYPDIDFVDCYMDPIMRRTSPVVPSLWRQMHRVLKRVPDEEKSGLQVNYIGNCFPYGAAYCDLTELFEENGIRVLEANSVPDYDTFLSMAKSKANIVFHNTGMNAAKDMKIRLGQEFIRMRPGYSYDEYDEDLGRAASLLGVPGLTGLSIQDEREKTDEAVEETRRLLGDTPVSLDYTAVDCPLELALFLLEHGFNVESVFVDVFTERQEIFEKLRDRKPDLKIYESLGPNIRAMERGHEGKVLCIGQKSAYFMNSRFFVNIVENAGMYGYRGLRRLMELIREAFREEKPMEQLVQIKGWGCSCIL